MTLHVSVTELASGLVKLTAAAPPQFILFKASWCPDCTRSLPAVEASVAASGGSLLVVEVGPAQQWRSSGHPLRVDARFPIECLPTLVRWTEDGQAGAIGKALEAARTGEEARAVVDEFVQRTKDSH